MSALRAAAAAMTALLLAVGLASCSVPEDSEWGIRARGAIVAVDNAQSVWIKGGRFWTAGGSYIDYQYAYTAKDGSIKQAMVSDLYKRYAYTSHRDGSMPSGAVSIYQDVEAGYDPEDPEQGPRIVVLQCRLQAEEAPEDPSEPSIDPGRFFAQASCTDPTTGGAVRGGEVRIEIHVPVGAVVDVDSLSPEEGEGEDG